jgi:hypothetical protein
MKQGSWTRGLLATCIALGITALGVGQASAKSLKHTPPGIQRLAKAAIADCAKDGDLDHSYPTRALLRAIDILPADIAQYTNCADVLHDALFKRYPKAAKVIQDCAADGDLDGIYTKGTLRLALRVLPSDIDQYTNCRSVINRAINRSRHRARR